MRELLFQGAESRIYRENYLGKDMMVKERFNKNYRHPELDNHLTKERIKAECRNIVRCKQFGIKTPAIYFVDLEKRLIYMEYFESCVTVKEHLQKLEKNDDLSIDKVKEIAELMGESIAKMHSNNIIHGDLTTSNFLLIKDQESKKYELVIIDFGLSHSEANDEDKAVDLYVLERALSSTHVNILEFFTKVLEKYCLVYAKKSQIVLNKFEEGKFPITIAMVYKQQEEIMKVLQRQEPAALHNGIVISSSMLCCLFSSKTSAKDF